MTFDESYFGAVDMHFVVPSPGSPPGMTSSKSSKTSSLHSFSSDESVLADVGHFEEIGLDDDAATIDSAYSRDLSQTKPTANPYSPSFASDLRAQVHAHATKPALSRAHTQQYYIPTRDLAHPRSQRETANFSRSNRAKLSGGLTTQFRGTSTSELTTLEAKRRASPLSPRGFAARSASSASADRRRRSPSPNHPLGSLNPRGPTVSTRPRRGSWQSARERKSVVELERECDEDEDDNIPDDFILDNVPLSPRPPSERTVSRSGSATPATSPSPERTPKDRVRNIGHGTPPVAAAHGSLRSPSWKSEASSAGSAKSPTICPSPIKTRAKSWTAAVSALTPETRALTEKLEDYADELDKNGIVRGTAARPVIKPRVKSALAELPPLRRTNIMIDPLPISKEKEAVLSRTRPSWLPPKDPAEEKRHLKEYQKMMANSIEAEKRREAARREKEKMKDAIAESLMHTWEEKVLRRWDDAMGERQTRDLWWKGVASRSRGTVWAKAVGNELELTEMSFQAALARAHEVEARIAQGRASTEDERRAGWFDRIKCDVRENTWVDLKIFQPGGPLHEQLIEVLYAYAMYRSDIGYVTGSNTVAALLLLNEPSASSAFITLANLLNRALPLSFYVDDDGAKASAYNLLLTTLAKKAPQLHQHLTNPDLALDPNIYLAELFTALFTRHLSLDEAARLWDVYIFEGDSILIRAAIALLIQKEGTLLVSKTSEEVSRALKLNSRRRNSDVQEDEWMKRVREVGKV